MCFQMSLGIVLPLEPAKTMPPPARPHQAQGPQSLKDLHTNISSAPPAAAIWRRTKARTTLSNDLNRLALDQQLGPDRTPRLVAHLLTYRGRSVPETLASAFELPALVRKFSAAVLGRNVGSGSKGNQQG